jgi:TPR repeat protein
MGRSIAFGLILLLVLPTAEAAGGKTTASTVFATASPSVVVVKAFDGSGQAVAQGSGVVIAPSVVISNCHVFQERRTESASVFYRDERYPATLRYADPTHDLCSFTVKNLDAPAARMRSAASLKVGEGTYAIGAPEGLSLTLSNGLVSSLRKMPEGAVIQTTAPISPGSSGGGLFDSEGRLIGITSYYLSKGQQLNFALPVEWIKALPQWGKTRKQLVDQIAKSHDDFMRGIKAKLSGDYTAAFAIFRQLAEHDDSDAQAELGWMYAHGEGVLQNYGNAAYWLRKAAKQENAIAQSNLGMLYVKGRGVPQSDAEAVYWFTKAAKGGYALAAANLGLSYYSGEGVPKNYAKAMYWLRRAAKRGVVTAQFALGKAYDNGHGVPQNYIKAMQWYSKAAKRGFAHAQVELGLMLYQGRGTRQDYATALYWWRKAAKQGNVRAQYDIGSMYLNGKGVAQDDVMAIRWYRKAAEQGGPRSQMMLGRAYMSGSGGVPRDRVQAVKWWILAKSGGDKSAGELLRTIEQMMTPLQISQAQNSAREWWATHHKE